MGKHTNNDSQHHQNLWLATSLLLISAFLAAGQSHATLVVPASAQTFTMTGVRPETGTQLAASASFWVSGSQLMVNLANISGDDVRAPVDILQAVYWDMASNISLSLASAIVESECNFPGGGAAGTCSASSTTYTGSQLSGKYAYNPNTNPPSTGIGSAGLGNFGGTNGMDWGILSAGDNLSTYVDGMKNNNPYVKNSVTFALNMTNNANGKAYKPASVGDLNISNVAWNYGTDTYLMPRPPTGMPEPVSLALIPLALGGMVWARRRRK